MKNLKIRMNYRTVAFLMLLGLLGCKKYEHKNVMTGIGSIDNQKVFFLEDIETGDERIYKFSKNLYPYRRSEIDDTILIVTGGFYASGRYYQKNTVLDARRVGIRLPEVER